MRESSPGPQAYSIDTNYVSKGSGKHATFSKEKRRQREDDPIPGPSDYELRHHVLS